MATRPSEFLLRRKTRISDDKESKLVSLLDFWQYRASAEREGGGLRDHLWAARFLQYLFRKRKRKLSYQKVRHAGLGALWKRVTSCSSVSIFGIGVAGRPAVIQDAALQAAIEEEGKREQKISLKIAAKKQLALRKVAGAITRRSTTIETTLEEKYKADAYRLKASLEVIHAPQS
ncbi:hypothetical protein CYMTET_27671 [Cymbomonas tetramitiformis]|uniref:Uncharacterized protein n=1 Tax=Cymbomonas tetramitiformis TaxID=36881 RepID=A0AAE0KWQ2_9CHLO|nr:hypothetical protein CYMTET_27671 [Cymbomonas tetramitiformis]